MPTEFNLANQMLSGELKFVSYRSFKMIIIGMQKNQK